MLGKLQLSSGRDRHFKKTGGGTLKANDRHFVQTKRELWSLMKKSRMAFTIIFGVLICAWLIVFPGYIHFYNLTEADIFRKAHIENPVLSDHLANLEKKFEGSVNLDTSQIFLENSTFHLSSFFFQALSPLRDFSPLRC